MATIGGNASAAVSDVIRIEQTHADNADDDILFAHARREHKRQRAEAIRAVDFDPIQEEVDRFFSTNVNWANVVKDNGGDKDVLAKIGTTEQSWMENWELISEYFEVMNWWEMTGKHQYPKIYLVACIILPLPDSNGNQE